MALKKNMPKIDIITVVRNDTKAYMATALSLSRQKNVSFLHIIIDGSDEGKKIPSRSISKDAIYIHGADKGIYDAMNKALHFVRQESFVLFLNAGDIFHDDFTLFTANLHLVDRETVYYGEHLVLGKNVKYRGKSKLNFTKGMPFCHQAVFCPSHFFDDNQFDIAYELSADFKFFFNLYRQLRNFSYIPVIVACIEPGGISDVKRIEVLREWKHILNDDYNKFFFFKRFIVEYLKKLMRL